MHIAPTRQGKSYTSTEAMKVFDKDFYIDLASDFTMNSLRQYKAEIETGRCLFVNDATTLFASKSHRTKDRLVGGLSELISDRHYTYQDYAIKFTLRGNVTTIFNMTAEAYKNYKDRLLGLTFSERLWTTHTVLSEQQKEDFTKRVENEKNSYYERKIKIADIATSVKIQPLYFKAIEILAKNMSYDSLNSPISCQDLIKGTMRANAALNQRTDISADDLGLIKLIRPHLINPFAPYDSQIIRLHLRGYSIRGICRELGKRNYERYVKAVLERAELRGVLSMPDSHTPKGLTVIAKKGTVKTPNG